MIDPLAELVFEAHGIAVRVRSATVAGSAVVTLLKQDFERFDASLSREPVIQIDIESELPRGPRAIPLFRNRMCRVSGWSQVRRCEYGGVYGAGADQRRGEKICCFRNRRNFAS